MRYDLFDAWRRDVFTLPWRGLKDGVPTNARPAGLRRKMYNATTRRYALTRNSISQAEGQLTMASRIVTKEEMLERVAVFRELTPSSRPLVDAGLPQFHRQIFNIIGGGVTEDATMKVPITAVDGFHLSIIKAGPGKGTGLHDHKTVEVFMPLTGTWSVQWGDEGENELTLGQWDVISVPTGIMRGFRNESGEEGCM